MACPCCRGPCEKCGSDTKCWLGCRPTFIVVSVSITWPDSPYFYGGTKPSVSINGTATLAFTPSRNCRYIYEQYDWPVSSGGGIAVSAPYQNLALFLEENNGFGHNVSARVDLCIGGSPRAYSSYPCPFNQRGEIGTNAGSNLSVLSYGLVDFVDLPNVTCFSSGSAAMSNQPAGTPAPSSGTITIVDAY